MLKLSFLHFYSDRCDGKSDKLAIAHSYVLIIHHTDTIGFLQLVTSLG